MVEARGRGPSKMPSARISGAVLRASYLKPMISEAVHHTAIIGTARRHGEGAGVDARWQELPAFEAELVTRYGRRPNMHG